MEKDINYKVIDEHWGSKMLQKHVHFQLLAVVAICFFLHAIKVPGVHSFGHFEKLALLKARTFTSRLKSVRSENRKVGPRAVKSARLPMLLRKARAFDKIDQNLTNLKAHTFAGQKCRISRAFWYKKDQNYELCYSKWSMVICKTHDYTT
jgi:hypothetical protein